MTGTRSSNGPEGPDAGSWATETLPMSVRKEMLERELSNLGFHKGGHEGGSAQQQQQPQGGGDHPQASEGQGGHSE